MIVSGRLGFRSAAGGQIQTKSTRNSHNDKTDIRVIADTGCDLYGSCLHCPFPFCRRHERALGVDKKENRYR